jgi:hypothetical protein
MTEQKCFHIYLNEKCMFHSLNETDFNLIWDKIQNNSSFEIEDFSYESLSYVKNSLINSSY